MAVFHRVDSIKEIKKRKKESQQGIMSMGKQITNLSMENMKKDQTIQQMGKQIVQNKMELMAMKKELDALKGGK